MPLSVLSILGMRIAYQSGESSNYHWFAFGFSHVLPFGHR